MDLGLWNDCSVGNTWCFFPEMNTESHIFMTGVDVVAWFLCWHLLFVSINQCIGFERFEVWWWVIQVRQIMWGVIHNAGHCKWLVGGAISNCFHISLVGVNSTWFMVRPGVLNHFWLWITLQTGGINMWIWELSLFEKGINQPKSHHPGFLWR